MARPVDADAEATRRRILETASALFADYGAGNTSMRQIARGAGVSQATIHHYFGTKDLLYESCIEAMYDELAELRRTFPQTIDGRETAGQIVARAVRATFRFGRDHQQALRLTQRELLNRGELRPEHRDRVLLPFLDEAVALLGAFVDKDARQLRLLLQSMNYLIVRYALATSYELALIAGTERAEAEDPKAQARAVDAIEEHLVSLAMELTGMG